MFCLKDYVLRTLFLLFFVCLIGNALATYLNSNLLHYYKFDESSGTILDYGSTIQNLTNSGGIQNITGKINKAIQFNGVNNQDTITGITSVSNAQTMNVWIFYNTSTQHTNLLFGSYAGATDLSFDYRTWDDAENITKPLINIGGVTIISPNDLNRSIWHMLTYTWSGTNDTNGVKLYVDGKKVAEGTTTRFCCFVVVVVIC